VIRIEETKERERKAEKGRSSVLCVTETELMFTHKKIWGDGSRSGDIGIPSWAISLEVQIIFIVRIILIKVVDPEETIFSSTTVLRPTWIKGEGVDGTKMTFDTGKLLLEYQVV